MADEPAVQVFLAYADQDRAWVEEFYTGLTAAGVKTWWDLADLRPGDEWRPHLERALTSADTMVFVLTPNSVANHWVLFELGAAIAGRKRIIPVVASPFDRSKTPPLIDRYQFLEESSPAEAARRVAEVVGLPRLH